MLASCLSASCHVSIVSVILVSVSLVSCRPRVLSAIEKYPYFVTSMSHFWWIPTPLHGIFFIYFLNNSSSKSLVVTVRESPLAHFMPSYNTRNWIVIAVPWRISHFSQKSSPQISLTIDVDHISSIETVRTWLLMGEKYSNFTICHYDLDIPSTSAGQQIIGQIILWANLFDCTDEAGELNVYTMSISVICTKNLTVVLMLRTEEQ